jgi:hypothetical protein
MLFGSLDQQPRRFIAAVMSVLNELSMELAVELVKHGQSSIWKTVTYMHAVSINQYRNITQLGL